MDKLDEALIKWASEDDGNDYIAINRLLQFLGNNLYHDYEPASGSFPEYYSRLKNWIFNCNTDKEQQTLLRFAQRIFYVGREEFGSLYRSAYNNIITRWITDQENISAYDDDAVEKIYAGLDFAWFCPITDSMRINQFYHVNNVTANHEFRPDWRSLRKFGDQVKIKEYISKSRIKYLVLLEDFVGSATQSWKPIKFACELDPELNVLFVPLIICKKGLAKINEEMKSFSNFTMNPVLIVGDGGFVTREVTIGEDARMPEFRSLIESSEPHYRNLKFGFEEMGCLLVMYTNTPTNSLPLIHYESNPSWTSLFKRHHRAKK